MTRRTLSPVLLVGAGTGEATCGILYLASHLRRNGIEAFVRLYDGDETQADTVRSLEALVAHVRPKLVGISLKWFHHVARAWLIAKTLRALDPDIRIVLGGNTATYFCRELLGWDCVDNVIVGDGELPLLSLCRNMKGAPNVVSRETLSARASPPLSYVQGSKGSDDVYYSHFDDIFLSQLDRHSFSGWVAPGKGCGENCLYCGGTRGMQKGTFGRAIPFLRSVESVQKDHAEIAPRTWQMRYDFAGSTAAFLKDAWGPVDLSKHSCTYFLWGVPPPELAQVLSQSFARVHMVLDIGCFSQEQRLEQMERGLLKPCPTNEELDRVIEASQAHPNLKLEISGIAGLPFANERTLKEERRLVKHVLGLGCAVGYQRLEAQPGALVTEHPERFSMRTEAKTFAEFFDYFAGVPEGDVSVPMVRYLDDALESAVQETSDEVDAWVWEAAAKANHVSYGERTRLVNATAATQTYSLGEWLGSHRAPARIANETATVIRAVDGAGVTCAPTVDPKVFSDASLELGERGRAILAVLDAFATPTPLGAGLKALSSKRTLDAEAAREVVDALVSGRFLQRVSS